MHAHGRMKESREDVRLKSWLGSVVMQYSRAIGRSTDSILKPVRAHRIPLLSIAVSGERCRSTCGRHLGVVASLCCGDICGGSVGSAWGAPIPGGAGPRQRIVQPPGGPLCGAIPSSVEGTAHSKSKSAFCFLGFWLLEFSLRPSTAAGTTGRPLIIPLTQTCAAMSDVRHC